MSEEKKEESSGRVLSLADIFAIDDTKYVDVPIPELGGQCIRLRTLTAKEAIDFTEQLQARATAKNAMVRIVALTAVNPDGSQMFPNSTGIDKLADRNVNILIRLQDAALEHNGMMTAQQIRQMMDKDSAVKELAKRRAEHAKNGSSEGAPEDSRIASLYSSDNPT